MTKSTNKELSIPKLQEVQLEDEALTECCASESTMGGDGRYRERGPGRFL